MRTRLNIIFLLLITVITRFLFFALRPLDGDEGIVIKIAESTNLSELFSAVAKDVHPPVFHFLEFLVLKISPVGEFSSRLISVLAGLVAVYFIYLVFKKLSSEKIAFYVAVLSTINPVLTYHFAEARPYGLLVLFIFINLYFFLKIKENASAKSEKAKDLVFFTLSSILMLLTAYLSFAILLGELLYLVIFEGLHKLNYKKIISGVLLIVTFALLWGSNFLLQLQGRMSEQSQTLQIKDNLIGLFNAFYRVFAGRMFLDLDPSISRNLEFLKLDPLKFIAFFLSVIVPLGLFAWGVIALFKNKKDNFYLIGCVFAPVILAALISSEIGPRSARYLLFLAPFCIYIILELVLLKKSLIKNLLFGAFVIIYVAAFAHGFYFERKKPGVDVIARFLGENAKVGDRVLVRGGFGGGEELILKYYLEKPSDFEITDLYSDYQTGNLAEIKSRDPLSYIENLKKSAKAKNVWFYDMTYSFDDSKSGMRFEKNILGKDKENKDLILYKF
ncbi:MAG: glycosyltransferase family 39 protein [bacterium]